MPNTAFACAVFFGSLLATSLSMRVLENGSAAQAWEDVTRKLLKSFRICGRCKEFKRLGEDNDGGYLTCMDNQSRVQGALSLGVEKHDQWTLDVHREFGVRIGQFDCTVPNGTDCGADCEFFRQCIGSIDGHEKSTLNPMITLQQAMDEMKLGNSSDGSLLMKIDIEGAEWPVFEVEPEKVLKKFNQIIIEFHDLHNYTHHRQMYKAVSSVLEAGFRVVHLHGNNFGGMYTYNEFQIPNVLEATFVADVEERDPCISFEASPLDAPNNGELPPAQLPE